jgi:hypothetical protein
MSARPRPCDGVAEGAQLSLTDAQSRLATAKDALNGWYARQTAEGERTSRIHCPDCDRVCRNREVPLTWDDPGCGDVDM